MAAEAHLPLPRRLWIYQAERFPLKRHGPLITVFCGAAALYGARLVGGSPSLPVLLGAILCSGAFFLLMRIADEFKDRHDDQRCRPYRPVPRGLVSLQELALVALATALLQGLLVWRVAPDAWWLLLLTWGWFALMGVEFLVPLWLRARPLLYTLSHMVIVPLIALLALAMAVLPAGGTLPGAALLPLLALCYLNGLAIEFARKIRFPDQEEPGVETWSALWGLGPAQARWLVVLLLSLPLALVAAQPIRAVPLVLLLLAPLLAWIVLRFRPVGRARRRAPGGIQRPAEMANKAAVIVSEATGAAGEAIKAVARVQSSRPEPLELPTALWTLATYLSLGWLPALLGGLG
jgi:4-hydroxybenzoate polyprenyltransferase